MKEIKAEFNQEIRAYKTKGGRWGASVLCFHYECPHRPRDFDGVSSVSGEVAISNVRWKLIQHYEQHHPGWLMNSEDSQNHHQDITKILL